LPWLLQSPRAGIAHAAGQPQLPGEAQGQASGHQRMEMKGELDVNKYQQPLPQAPANVTEQSMKAGETGVAPRSTKVAPSREINQPSQPKTAETGVPPRGTKVAP
jgi:hypothetical protein